MDELDVAWMNSRTRSRRTASIRSNRASKRQTAVSASNRGNEEFVEHPAGSVTSWVYGYII